MRNDRRQSPGVAQGMAILAALVLVVAGIFYLDELTRLATPRYAIVGVFPEGGEIHVGTPVWLAGREVGRVRALSLRPVSDSGPAGLVAELELRREVRELVRRDSRISIGAPTPLVSPLVRIRPGTTHAAPLEPLDTLWEGEGIDVEAVTDRLTGVLAQLDTVLTTSQRLGADAEARSVDLETIGARYRAASAELHAMAGAVDRGSLRLLADPAFRARLDRLAEATAAIGRRADSLAARVRDAADGAPVGERLRAAGERMRGVSRALEALRRTLDDPNTTLARLRQDSALAVALRGVRAQIDSLVAEARREGPALLF